MKNPVISRHPLTRWGEAFLAAGFRHPRRHHGVQGCGKSPRGRREPFRDGDESRRRGGKGRKRCNATRSEGTDVPSRSARVWGTVRPAAGCRRTIHSPGEPSGGRDGVESKACFVGSPSRPRRAVARLPRPFDPLPVGPASPPFLPPGLPLLPDFWPSFPFALPGGRFLPPEGAFFMRDYGNCWPFCAVSPCSRSRISPQNPPVFRNPKFQTGISSFRCAAMG